MKARFSLFFVLAILLLFVPQCFAVDSWVTANQKTIGWDAVTTTAPGGVISYKVYIANAVTDPTKANAVEADGSPTSDTQFVVTLGTEGQYVIGVSTVLTIGTEVLESKINWSDDPIGNAGGTTFGLQHFVIVAPEGFGVR